MKSALNQRSKIFRGLGNPNRLRILQILTTTDRMSVSELAKDLGITLKNTSRNLSILLNLDLVEYEGKHDRVYYSINPRMEKDTQQILTICFK